MKIILRTLEKGETHFCNVPTCGDWYFWNNDDLEATVDHLDCPDSEIAVLIHELIEAHLCRKRGITSEQVSEFDRGFEEERQQGKHGPLDEPGDSELAPYLQQHRAATDVERAVCQALGITWEVHENNINAINNVSQVQ